MRPNSCGAPDMGVPGRLASLTSVVFQSALVKLSSCDRCTKDADRANALKPVLRSESVKGKKKSNVKSLRSEPAKDLRPPQKTTVGRKLTSEGRRIVKKKTPRQNAGK